MALNRVREKCTQVSLPVPEGTKSGDPVAVGKLVGVALIDRDKDTPGEATCQIGEGSYEFDVEGNKGKAEEEQAIEPGEPVYLDPATGKLNANSGKTLFGYAIGPVAKGKTVTVEVKIASV
jgi:predicted RecA/RadA family phage recombinase